MPHRPTEAIPLWEGEPPASTPDDASGDASSGMFRPWLEPYPLKGDVPRGAVLVCPGGGYSNRAPHEAAPIARRFNEAGYHAFVVQYRVAPHRHPAPLLDAARAMEIIRDRASEWQVDADRIGVCGFSAGGHLAGSLGVHFDHPVVRREGKIEPTACRPNALILCYPVISTGPCRHCGSFTNLLGPTPSDSELAMMSLEQQVTEATPPAFLWHTADDGVVPVENSIRFAIALREHGVPFELHIYPSGRHGLGLAPEDPHVATWADLCCEWLGTQGW